MKKNKVIPLAYIKRWWSKQSTKDEKGGSFNMDLYLRVCEIKLINDGQVCRISDRKI